MRKLGTFAGVFTPTILTILGVIMYLRLGWVVGNAGFGGALVIIILAKMITVTTGLSIAAIATNTRVGAGGSYALISRSLGLEAGSAVGIPLYLSQTLGGAMYISGFTEAWISLFPAHDPLLIGIAVLVLVLGVSLLGAQFAMRTQYVIMFVIAASLVSFFSATGDPTPQIIFWGDFPQASFWVVFAIFFPAVTGIEAGAAMSGDLKDSKRSLPIGMLSAIAVSFVIYVAVAYYLDQLAEPGV
ncbi:MAG: sodium transporter, partial [Candidatus Marinimicrobia bacterium]|nr:sodium transporter [Candidatus Neomarinimicrobiota bacterium]